MVWPTRPVAPTTATVIALEDGISDMATLRLLVYRGTRRHHSAPHGCWTEADAPRRTHWEPRLGEGNSVESELTFPSMVARGRGRPPHPDVLTPAEWGVLEMWRHGMGRSEIASRRGISQYAVRYHLRNIAGKLGVEHYSELRHWPGFASTSLRREQSPMATTTKLDLGELRPGLAHEQGRGRRRALVQGSARAVAHLHLRRPRLLQPGHHAAVHPRHTRQRGMAAVLDALFRSPDIQVAYDELQRRGVHFLGAPHMIFKDDSTGVEEWMAFFDDPDGNTLAVMSRVSPSA